TRLPKTLHSRSRPGRSGIATPASGERQIVREEKNRDPRDRPRRARPRAPWSRFVQWLLRDPATIPHFGRLRAATSIEEPPHTRSCRESRGDPATHPAKRGRHLHTPARALSGARGLGGSRKRIGILERWWPFGGALGSSRSILTSKL